MKLFWNLNVMALAVVVSTMSGCGGDSSSPPASPKIDLGASSDAAPTGNSEPETKQEDSPVTDAKPGDNQPVDPKPAEKADPAKEPKSEDKPKVDGEAKSDHPTATDNEVASIDKKKPVKATGSGNGKFDPTAETLKLIKLQKVKDGDWPSFGGSYFRNNTPEAKGIATDWNVDDGTNIKWAAKLGSETYGNPVIANGKVYIGTNNGSGYMKRYPAKVDLGCLICFDEETGEFLWQHSSEKLPTGRVHDWPNQGICCAPLVIGDRLWYVTSRGEVICLDTEGNHDGENDTPFLTEKPDKPDVEWDEKHEADVIWKFDMMGKLGVSQHNMCACSVTYVGSTLFVHTANGVDEGHISLPQPTAPSFIALDMLSGEVLWTDSSPGENVLHGQWSSPGYGLFNGQEQVLFAGGDGWLYAFDPKGEDGKSKLLWKFDCNPKESIYVLGGRATRNHLIGTPVVYDGLVYIAVGEDPEHGEGIGHLWCIDPNKRGDVSPTQVFNPDHDGGNSPIPHKRLKALEADKGDVEKPNPNAAAVWHYIGNDPKQKKFEETMHRTCGTVAIKNDLLFVADFSGLVHCVDAKTGKAHWTFDMLAASWSSPLIVEDRVYISDEDGDISIFALSADPAVAMKEMKNIEGKVFMKDGKPERFPLNGFLPPGADENDRPVVTNMGSAVFTSPVVANDRLFIANRSQIFCIQPGTKSKVEKPMPVSAGSD